MFPTGSSLWLGPFLVSVCNWCIISLLPLLVWCQALCQATKRLQSITRRFYSIHFFHFFVLVNYVLLSVSLVGSPHSWPVLHTNKGGKFTVAKQTKWIWLWSWNLYFLLIFFRFCYHFAVTNCFCFWYKLQTCTSGGRRGEKGLEHFTRFFIPIL